jgi:FixJ family two-component response regulator
VAVVDDDPRVLESLADLLESEGYDARTYSSASVLLVAGFSGVDAIISDIGMAGVDGFELRNLVSKVLPRLPIFLITGRHELAEQGRAQGISGFFRKPFDGQALLAAVADALRGKEGKGDDEC